MLGLDDIVLAFLFWFGSARLTLPELVVTIIITSLGIGCVPFLIYYHLIKKNPKEWKETSKNLKVLSFLITGFLSGLTFILLFFVCALFKEIFIPQITGLTVWQMRLAMALAVAYIFVLLWILNKNTKKLMGIPVVIKRVLGSTVSLMFFFSLLGLIALSILSILGVSVVWAKPFDPLKSTLLDNIGCIVMALVSAYIFAWFFFLCLFGKERIKQIRFFRPIYWTQESIQKSLIRLGLR